MSEKILTFAGDDLRLLGRVTKILRQGKPGTVETWLEAHGSAVGLLQKAGKGKIEIISPRKTKKRSIVPDDYGAPSIACGEIKQGRQGRTNAITSSAFGTGLRGQEKTPRDLRDSS